MADVISFVCSCCGERHQGLPDLADGNPEGNWIDSDHCMIGGEDFFIRCVLLIPILGTASRLG